VSGIFVPLIIKIHLKVTIDNVGVLYSETQTHTTVSLILCCLR